MDQAKTQSKYDDDLLGDDVIPEDERPPKDKLKKKVKDMYYYDKLVGFGSLHP
jgi:hypothetical protein